MAQRIPPQAAHPVAAAPQTNELHILHPERELLLGGQQLTVLLPGILSSILRGISASPPPAITHASIPW